MEDILRLEDVAFSYGEATVLENLSLSVSRGEILGLCGESGCGKTTTLRIVAGLLQPQHGSVLIKGTDVTYTDPRRWGIGAVFQEPALYPWYRVRANIALRLKFKGVARDARKATVEKIADEFGIRNLLDRHMDELSGGQRQRVALAGEMIDEELKLILFDEPFNSLDPDTRAWFDEWTRARIRQSGKAAIFVTHDATEAKRVCDRIAHMKRGFIEDIEFVERKHALELN